MKWNVLIFPAGAENALEIYEALRYNLNVEVFGASGKKDFAEYKYPNDKYIEGDFWIYSKDFKANFQMLLEKYKIDIVIPTHDDAALYFAENRNQFNVRILVSDARTAKICREKRLMYQEISDMPFCPITYQSLDAVPKEDFPVFVKPNIGAGGRGAFCIKSREDARKESCGEEFVVAEFLPGKELTVDCFTNRKGELVFVGARSRDRIQMGIAFRSTRVSATDEIYQMAKILNGRLSCLGAWYFQVKEDKEGQYKLLEISCRQSGTMTLYRHLGINFPMLGVFELMGRDTSYVLNSGECQIERCLMTKFKYECSFENVYIDMDDTIIIDGKVCTVIIAFIYQCVNMQKKIFLLTRHEGDLSDFMEKHKLSETLFDKIYHIGFDVAKATFIDPQNSIFIDNSYQERKAIYEMYGIPVFDVDMVDMLLEG